VVSQALDASPAPVAAGRPQAAGTVAPAISGRVELAADNPQLASKRNAIGRRAEAAHLIHALAASSPIGTESWSRRARWGAATGR
jgi:hypothetical protein